MPWALRGRFGEKSMDFKESDSFGLGLSRPESDDAEDSPDERGDLMGEIVATAGANVADFSSSSLGERSLAMEDGVAKLARPVASSWSSSAVSSTTSGSNVIVEGCCDLRQNTTIYA
jgi:hypothetical protein